MTKIPIEIIDACLAEYQSSFISIPNLAKKYGVNYRNLKYAFFKIGVTIEKRGNGHIGLKRSTQTKKNISKAKSGKPNPLKAGKKYTAVQRLTIIKNQCKFPFSIDEYTNVDKFLLVKAFSNQLFKLTEYSKKEQFIKYFYYDELFDYLYTRWLAISPTDKYLKKMAKPSIDHIIPISRGGSSDLSNLCVMTWFENRAKVNMTDSEWLTFKKLTNTTSSLFTK